MNEQELRALVREAVRRNLAPVAPSLAPSSVAPALPASSAALATTGGSMSHAMYLTLVNPGDSCLIEPAVPCNHCGYCKTHGH